MLSRGGFNETFRIHGMKIQTYLMPDVSDNNDALLHSFCFHTADRRNLGPSSETSGYVIDFLSVCKILLPFKLVEM
jgi:hypothetical protein